MNKQITKIAYQIADFRVRVVHHRVLEGSQEVLLELEVRKLLLLKEPHGKLSQIIQGEERDMGIVVTAHLRILRENAKKKGRARRIPG